MITPFIPIERWIKWKDVERCPYPMFRNHPKFTEWNDADDRRLFLIALDRYAEYLQRHSRTERVLQETSSSED